jgi:tetratricopeptide (TPR) repeat protein
MTVFTARAPFRSVWRIYELVMNRTDTLWAPLLEAEAGRRLLQKLPAAALPLQRDAVALTPLSAQSHHNLALILAALGQTSEARAEVRRALELNPALDASRCLEEMLTSSSATDS